MIRSASLTIHRQLGMLISCDMYVAYVRQIMRWLFLFKKRNLEKKEKKGKKFAVGCVCMLCYKSEYYCA